MSSSLAEATIPSGTAFAADIRTLLKEHPINRKALQKRINREDGRRGLLEEYAGRVAPEALFALAAAELVISPNINRVRLAAGLRQLATTCKVTGRLRHDHDLSIENEFIELTIGAVENMISQLQSKRCGNGCKQQVKEYQELLRLLRNHVARLPERQAA